MAVRSRVGGESTDLTNIRRRQPHSRHLLGQAQFLRSLSPESSLLTVKEGNIPQRFSGETRPVSCLSRSSYQSEATRLSQPQSCVEFQMLTQRVVYNNKTDVLLKCLGSVWRLHPSQVTRSGTLSSLYRTAWQKKSQQWKSGTGVPVSSRAGRLFTPITLNLPDNEPCLSKEDLTFALRCLHDPAATTDLWGEGVLSAALLLGMPHLYQRCISEMTDRVNTHNVCDFHRVSCKYNEAGLKAVCERWLELYMVIKLSWSFYLRELPFELLYKTLTSPRLYAGSEFQLVQMVLYWVYFQLNPTDKSAPSWTTTVKYFSRPPSPQPSSWPMPGVLLEQPNGLRFVPLFQALRLHGVTKRYHLKGLQQMNVFPPCWLLDVFSRHYHALYTSGDMKVTDFSQQAVRFGLVIEKEPQYSTRSIELYGFHFILKAVILRDTDTHGFSLQRIMHDIYQDVCEKRPMSNPLTTYQIKVQAQVGKHWQEFSSGIITQVFGLTEGTIQSEVFKVKGLKMPIFVTFALAFTSSDP